MNVRELSHTRLLDIMEKDLTWSENEIIRKELLRRLRKGDK